MKKLARWVGFIVDDEGFIIPRRLEETRSKDKALENALSNLEKVNNPDKCHIILNKREDFKGGDYQTLTIERVDKKGKIISSQKLNKTDKNILECIFFELF